jgi:hypothetical protein
MSYLDIPRLHFSGRFQADVSTINNDVRYFDNAGFQEEYQSMGQGGWNPEGTGIFRLVECRIMTFDVTSIDNMTAREIGSFSARTKGPQPLDVGGKYVVIWRKILDDWKITTDIWNRTVGSGKCCPLMAFASGTMHFPLGNSATVQ